MHRGRPGAREGELELLAGRGAEAEAEAEAGTGIMMTVDKVDYATAASLVMPTHSNVRSEHGQNMDTSYMGRRQDSVQQGKCAKVR